MKMMAGMNARLLFLAPLLVAFVPPLALEEEIRFTPKDGSAFELSYTQDFALSLQSVQIAANVNGEEREQELTDVSFDLNQNFGVTLNDEVLAVEDGMITKLRRSFSGIERTRSQSGDSPDGPQTHEESGESDLDGRAVVFSWDAEEESYTVAFDEDEDADEELLDDLYFDVYLKEFLPEDAVSVDDSWEVDVSAWNEMDDPSGDLQVVFESESEDDEESDTRQQYIDNLEGSIVCTLNEVVEEDGARIALIGVVIDASTTSSTSQDVDDEGVTGTYGEDVELTWVYEGTIRWSLSDGHAMGFELSGEISYEVESSRDLARDEMTLVDNRIQFFEGEYGATCTVSAGSSEE